MRLRVFKSNIAWLKELFFAIQNTHGTNYNTIQTFRQQPRTNQNWASFMGQPAGLLNNRARLPNISLIFDKQIRGAFVIFIQIGKINFVSLIMKFFFFALCFIAISFDHSDAHCCGPNIDIFVSNLGTLPKLVPTNTY